MIDAFPDRTIFVLPLLSTSDLTFRLQLDRDIYLINTAGNFAGPENAELARVVDRVLKVIDGIGGDVEYGLDDGPVPF